MARKALAEARDGKDPAEDRVTDRNAPTIRDLADRYLAEHVAVHNRPSTEKGVRFLVDSIIKPKLGHIPVADLTRGKVLHWHHELRDTPYNANRALAALSKMMSLASRDWGLRADNPCLGIRKYREGKRERFFSEAELTRIGTTLKIVEGERSTPEGFLVAVRLLALTGMRLGEVLSCRWEDVDLSRGTLRLRDAKAGPRTVALGGSAVALLERLVDSKKSEFVVPGPLADRPLSRSTVEGVWARFRKKAGLKDARLHDFRHTSATYAAQAGYNAFMVRDLLGHKTLAMAGRYVERAPEPIRHAADNVSARIDAAMGGEAKEDSAIMNSATRIERAVS